MKYYLEVELKDDKHCDACIGLQGEEYGLQWCYDENIMTTFVQKSGFLTGNYIRPANCPLQLAHHEECSVNDWDLK